MRSIVEHRVNPANATLRITATDEPGPGGASHRYEITGLCTDTNAAATPTDLSDSHTILFQNGPVGTLGVNGLTHEALLAIVADRLRSLQGAAAASVVDACALTHVEQALRFLQMRANERMRRCAEDGNAATTAPKQIPPPPPRLVCVASGELPASGRHRSIVCRLLGRCGNNVAPRFHTFVRKPYLNWRGKI